MNIFTIQKKRMSMIDIFKKCIGEENGISAHDLFVKYYGEAPSEFSQMEIFWKWNVLHAKMNYLRRKSFLFIVSKNNKYFIVTSSKEASQYISRLENTKNKIDFMIKRCEKAIDEEFYKRVEQGEFFEKKRRLNGVRN